MKKVNRLKVQNSFTKKIMIVLLFLFVGSILTTIALKVINKSMSYLAYDLGEKDLTINYQDFLLHNYDEYLNFIEKYHIEQNLKSDNFINNYYLVSFQEYDKCAESKFKEVIDIKYEENIKVIFKVHNKCGWCKSHVAVHLIQIDQIQSDEKVEYDYIYAKDLNCGTIK